MSKSLTQLSLALLAALATATASADVRWEIASDGTRVMVNDPPPRRSAAAPTPLSELVAVHAGEARLDPRLVDAVIRAESAYDANALSPKGAMGLMQLMPETARLLGVTDPWDPWQNVRGGTVYLRRMLDRFDGRLDLALAGYNAGPSTVDHYGGVPPYPETRRYVERVLRLYGGEGEVARWARPPVGRPVFLTRRPGEGLILTTAPQERR